MSARSAQLRGRSRARAEARALAALLRPVRGPLLVARVLAAVAAAAALAPYLGLAELGRALLAEPVDADRVGRAVALVLAGMGLRALALTAALFLTHHADLLFQEQLRRRMLAVVGRAPLSWFTQRSSGRIRSALDGDATQLHYLVAHQDVEMTMAVLTPALGLGYCFWVDWRLGLLSVATIPAYLLIYGWMSRGQADGIVRLNEGLERVSAAIAELVAGVAVIKTFGRTGRAHAQYRQAAQDYRAFFLGWMWPLLRIAALAGILLAAPVVAGVNLFGGWLLIAGGQVGPVDVVVTTLIALIIPTAILTVSNGMWSRTLAGQAAYRVLQVLDAPQLGGTPVRRDHDGLHGMDVAFEGVTFGYDPSTPVLHDVSLTVPAGTTTALVGPSGSGKSTLAMLVPRFADPDRGRVCLGGVDVRDMPPEELYRTVGFVLQEVHLLILSVRDNIRLAVPDAPDAEVERVARAAQIHDVIAALPRGYDAVVGLDAVLSGGERQRLCIARAILADPPVVVLDEATSFADPESEAAVQEALGVLLAGRTVLVIAHRLQTITGCDQIAVFDRGRLVERGRHADLLCRGGRYARMWATSQPEVIR